MNRKRRLAFDTNVMVSAVCFPRSTPARAFAQGVSLGTIVSSSPTLKELSQVLKRKKFDAYVTEEERNVFLVRFIQNAIHVSIAERITACRDPKDNKFLELAVNGRADFLVTGDNDLLVLNPFRNVFVVTPADLMTRFATDRTSA